jgi:hypothetical protein
MYTTTTAAPSAAANPFAALAMLDRLIPKPSSKPSKRRRNSSKLSDSSSSSSSSNMATAASSSSDSLAAPEQQQQKHQQQSKPHSSLKIVDGFNTMKRKTKLGGIMLGPEIPSPIKECDDGDEQLRKQSPQSAAVQPITAQGQAAPTVFTTQSSAAPKEHDDELEEAPLFVLFTTYLGYLVLIIFGHIRDFFGKILKRHQYSHLKAAKGYAPLTSDFESFYTRRLYTRIRDCWNRPITGVPGRTVTLLERVSDDFNKSFRYFISLFC